MSVRNDGRPAVPAKFDPYAALEHQRNISNAVAEAVDLIENDRPNAARRLLISEVMEGRAAQRIVKQSMLKARAE